MWFLGRWDCRPGAWEGKDPPFLPPELNRPFCLWTTHLLQDLGAAQSWPAALSTQHWLQPGTEPVKVVVSPAKPPDPGRAGAGAGAGTMWVVSRSRQQHRAGLVYVCTWVSWMSPPTSKLLMAGRFFRR